MKLSPPRLVVAVAAPEMNSNAKRSMQATVQYKMRGSIIIGRLYTIEQRSLARWMAKSLSFERQRHV